MTTLPIQRHRSRRRDPAAIVDEVGVRVLGHRKSQSGRLIVEIELDLPPCPGKPPSVIGSPALRPHASSVRGDGRRDADAVAISALAGFALVSAVASLLAILI